MRKYGICLLLGLCLLLTACAAGRWRTPASRPRRTIPFISRTASW